MTYLKHIHITNTYITIYSIKFASIHIARNMNSDNLTNVISYNSFCLALSWALFSYHIVCNPILYPGFLFLFSIDTVFPLPPTKCMRHIGLMPVFPHLDFWFIVCMGLLKRRVNSYADVTQSNTESVNLYEIKLYPDT